MDRISFYALLGTAFLTIDLPAQFNPGVLFVQNIPNVQEVRVLDLDGVNGADVIVRQPSSLIWLRNENGSGNYPAIETIHGSMDLLDAFDFADVEGDGDLDLVIGDRGADAILLLRNDGMGGFGSPEVVVEMNGGVVGRIHLVDVQDGQQPELLFLTQFGPISLIVNEGGAFGDVEVIADGLNTEFQVLDVDGDGDQDVAAFVGPLSGQLRLSLNPAVDGEPWEQIQQVFGQSLGNGSAQVLDVDGDGDMDVVNAGDALLRWWRFPIEGNGPYSLAQASVQGSSAELFRRGWAAHLGCGPGATMLWTDSIGEPVQWSTYDPTLGAFAPISLLPDLPSFQAIHSGDVNGDGKEDLVLWHDNNLSWFGNAISDPVTSVALTPFDVLCSAGDPYQLDHATPEGGIWRGSGVSAGVFTPDGPGTFELSYCVVDEGSGCPVVASQNIVVSPLPEVTLELPFGTSLVGDDPWTLSGGFPEDGIYSIGGVSTTQFDPIDVAVGDTVVVTYEYEDPVTGCANLATDSVIIDGTVGFDHLHSRPAMSLRPNPASTTVRFLSPIPGGLRILDGLGRVVQQGRVPEGDVMLDVSTLRPGTYWVEVTGPSGSSRERLIVAR